MKSRTMACTAKWSCEVIALLRYYTVLSANSLPMFQDNLSWSSVLGLHPLSNFLKGNNVSEAGKEVANLVDPLDWPILILGKWPTWSTILFYVFMSILYMFRATSCSSSGESIVSIQHLVFVTLCWWPFRAQVGKELSDLHIRSMTFCQCGS